MQHRLAATAAMAVAVACPVATGTIPDSIIAWYLAAAILLVVGLVVPWPARARPWTMRVALGVAASAVSLTIVDTAARPALRWWLEPSPTETYGDPYPKMPLIGRYTPNVRYHARAFGDLSRPLAYRDDREYRDLVWISDAAGFRNDPATLDPSRPLDLILLGDSFGEGGNTSHEQTWGALFRTRYGLATYNLSMVAASPWHEYVTLASEIDRLHAPRGALVVWALFTGNDLDGGIYYATVDLAQLPWQGTLGRLEKRYQRFRDRSPVRRTQQILRETATTENRVLKRTFVDGRSILFFGPYAMRAHATLDMVEHHPYYPVLEMTVAATAKLARERGLRLVIVLIPSKEEVYGWTLDGGAPWSTSTDASALSIAVGKMAKSHDIEYLDLKPLFVEESRRAWERSRTLLWWRDDTHWNDAGNALAARAVHERFVAPVSPRGGRS